MLYEIDRGPKYSNGPRYTFGGHSRHIYSDSQDLVSLKIVENEDRLTSVVERYLPLLFKVRPFFPNLFFLTDMRPEDGVGRRTGYPDFRSKSSDLCELD